MRSVQSKNTSPSSALLTMEDMRIRADRLSLRESSAYRRADERDYTAMQACRTDRDAVDMEAHGLSENVATRIHQGFLAFRGLV